MSVELHQRTVEADPVNVIDGIDDALIDNLWHELDNQLPRERVKRVVTEVGQAFQNATVKTFMPIFVYRRALERLRQELDEMAFIDNRYLDEN